MIHSLFILTFSGEVLIEKHWRKPVNRAVTDVFMHEVKEAGSPNDVPPIIPTPRYYLLHLVKGSVLYLAALSRECAPALVFDLLDRIHKVFCTYLGKVEPDSIKASFAICYELLDEMLDYGFPVLMEPNALTSIIEPPTVMGRVFQAVAGTSGIKEISGSVYGQNPWRPALVSYTTNEISIQCIEKIDAVITGEGRTLRTRVRGRLLCTTQLSGMPQIKITFQNPTVVHSWTMHPSVLLKTWTASKQLMFVPPDGTFLLMEYDVGRESEIHLPIYCKPMITYKESEDQSVVGSLTVMVGNKFVPHKSSVPIVLDQIAVRIPLPEGVTVPTLVPNYGHTVYDPTTRLVYWVIGQLPRDQTPILNGTFPLKKGSVIPRTKESVLLDFLAPNMSISHLLPTSIEWVNTDTKFATNYVYGVQSGTFEIRMP